MRSIPIWGLVASGGALGALARYWLGDWLLRQFGKGLPWGTLAANLLGAFAAGFLTIWLEGRDASSQHWRAFLIVGVLGAFTTYSALMLECLIFARTARSGWIVGYLALSLAAGLLLVWLGARCAEAMRLHY
ncbi:MAG: CrcB family protein [Lysobacteraceae bacterium]|nr:MAG: CrcB family protein [Xanthomonadaceae bacterium]